MVIFHRYVSFPEGVYIYIYLYTVYSTYIVHRNGGYLATEYKNAKQHLLCIHSSVIATFPKCFGYIYIYMGLSANSSPQKMMVHL